MYFSNLLIVSENIFLEPFFYYFTYLIVSHVKKTRIKVVHKNAS